MAHPNQIPSDAAVQAKLAIAPFSTMPSDDGGAQDEVIAQALNALTVAGPTLPVPKAQIVEYYRQHQLWLGEDGKSGIKNSANVAALYAVDLYLDPNVTTIDFTNQLIMQMMEDLVTGQLQAAADVTALEAMGSTTIPWWQSIEAPSALNAHDIVRAREYTAP